jgi:hypothetical protein
VCVCVCVCVCASSLTKQNRRRLSATLRCCGVTSVLRGCCAGVARVLQGCYKGCYKDVKRVSQGCKKGVTRGRCYLGEVERRGWDGRYSNLRCHKGVTMTLQGCYTYVTRALQGYYNCYLGGKPAGRPEVSPGSVTRVLQAC